MDYLPARYFPDLSDELLAIKKSRARLKGALAHDGNYLMPFVGKARKYL
jgi:hypothetical protein